MKILLISPSESKFVNYSKAKKTICPALPLIAAYTPREHEVIIANQGQGDNVYLPDVDLVGISAMTPQVHEGYKIAKYYRDKGVKVVMGGIHASVLPDEALSYVDAVCIGEGDALWEKIIDDVKNGQLKKIYKADELFPMEKIPPFRNELVKKEKMTFSHTIVQATRGCPYNCEFCITPALFGRKYRFRPVENVINEIKGTGNKFIIFIDDNIFGSPSYCEELFKALVPLKIRWAGQASLNSTTRDINLLKLAKKSGCIGLFIGLESISQVSKQSSNSFSKMGSQSLLDISNKIQLLLRNGIMVQSSIVFGLDGDDHTIFEKTVDFLKINNVSLSSFCVLTPYPGTKIYEKFKSEGRLMHEDWSKYCNQHVVFYPKGMTPEQLKKGSDWAGQAFYKKRSIVKRLPAKANLKNLVYYIGMNILTRRANLKNNALGSITSMTTKEIYDWRSSLARYT